MVVVKVDHRERGSGVPEKLRELGVGVYFTELKVGDYSTLSNRIGIERKTSEDFLASIYDGRLFDQARRLAEAYKRPVLIVEGGLEEALLLTHRPRAIWGAVARLIVDHPISIISTPSYVETAELIRLLVEKDSEKAERVEIVRAKPRLYTLREKQLFLVQGLPGIGPKLAKRLLEHFGTVRAIFTARPVELELIVGRRRAEKILEVLHQPYKSRRALKSNLGKDGERGEDKSGKGALKKP